VHFSVKYDVWWEQFYLFCKELTDQIQCSLSNKRKKHGGTTNLKMGATSNLLAKRAEKNWSIAELSHFVLCVFRYFIQFAIEKKISPSFQFFTPPNFF